MTTPTDPVDPSGPAGPAEPVKLQWHRSDTVAQRRYADGDEFRYYVETTVDSAPSSPRWFLAVYPLETVAGVRIVRPGSRPVAVDEGYTRMRDAQEVAQMYENVGDLPSSTQRRLTRALSAWMDLGKTATESTEPTGPTGPTPAATVEVLDSRGHHVTLAAGLLDDDAERVYLNGQCLALAVALAQQTGWPVHLSIFAESTEAAAAGNLRHAYAQAPDGSLVDVRGCHDADIVEEECRDLDGDLYRAPRLVPADQAHALLEEFAPQLVYQDLAAAATFVSAVLDRVTFSR